MDVLVSEAKVITHRTGNKSLPCLTTKTKYLKVRLAEHCCAFDWRTAWNSCPDAWRAQQTAICGNR